MSKVYWNTAPKDAQFYAYEYFRKHEDGKGFCWDGSIWREEGFDSLEWHKKEASDFEMRPEEPKWDGKSALKAGDKAMTAGGECIVLGIDLSKDQAAVQWLDDGDLGVILIDCVNPLPSERDKWISEAQKHCAEFFGNQLGRIYDAMMSGKLEKP